MMTPLVPQVLFNHVSEDLDLFVDCLGFKILHQDGSLAVAARGDAKVYVVESPKYAAKDRPKIAIEADSIGGLYKEILSKRPDVLHPNSKVAAKKPWGAQEFAVLDKTGVCVVFRQW